MTFQYKMDQQMFASDILDNQYELYKKHRTILTEKFHQILAEINEIISCTPDLKALELIMMYERMREIEREHYNLTKYTAQTLQLV